MPPTHVDGNNHAVRPDAARIKAANLPGGKYSFELHNLSKWCPWYEDALVYWKARLGNDIDAVFAIAAILHDVDASTMKNYGSKYRAFSQFCENIGASPLPATPATVVKYVGFLARKGTIKASSMGQYLACISKAHVHLRMPTPVSMSGDLINAVQQGVKRLQKTVYDTDHVLYLPAEYASECLDWCTSVQPQISAYLAGDSGAATVPLLLEYRDSVGLVFNFCDFGRADSQSKMKDTDIVVDGRGQVVFRLRHVKGRSGNLTNLVFQWPPLAQPGLLAVLRTYLDVRRQSAPGKMWVLDADGRSGPDTTHKFDKMIQRALSARGLLPPGAGFKYSTRSLRAGAASACNAIELPLTKIRHFGGWSPDSATPERVYIDPSCPPTPACSRFFGWTRFRPPRHL